MVCGLCFVEYGPPRSAKAQRDFGSILRLFRSMGMQHKAGGYRKPFESSIVVKTGWGALGSAVELSRTVG
eukprot:1150921-Alexandrium_andersonii.AAC.1